MQESKRGKNEAGREIGKAGGLLGVPVVTLSGEELGQVEEIMIDTGSGRASYAVLSFGALSGMGDRLFPVPWPLLKLDNERRQFVLKLVRERLKTAPCFERHDWPRMSDREWAVEIHAFYGEKPYWEECGMERRGSTPGRRMTDHWHAARKHRED